MAPLCPVDLGGRFTEEVRDFKGQHVKVLDYSLVNIHIALTRLVIRMLIRTL